VRINEIIEEKIKPDENRHNNIIAARGGTPACKWHRRVGTYRTWAIV